MNNNVSPNNKVVAKKRKKKFNVIDFFVLVLVVAIIAALVYSFSPWSKIKNIIKSNEVAFKYEVEFQDVDKEFINSIKKGEVAINSSTKTELGTVESITTTPDTFLDYVEKKADDETVTYEGVLVEDTEKYDIIVYITTTAQYESGVGYTVNGTRVAVGEAISFRFPHFEATGYCIAID